MNHFFKKFIRCGIAGWCMEIIFTGLISLRRRDYTLKGTTSLWMFPIYGCASFLSPIAKILKNKPLWLRGLTYMTIIFSAEYAAGRVLNRKTFCPWNYHRSKWNVKRFIRLDFAPFWFGAGLFFERLLLNMGRKTAKLKRQ